jgi:hypothetical protein
MVTVKEHKMSRWRRDESMKTYHEERLAPMRELIAQLMVTAHDVTLELARFHTATMDDTELSDRMTRYIKAGHALADNWYPACGGTERPFVSRGGHRLLYVWQPATGNHAYLNLDTDVILSDDEARQTLGTF